jgi:hypothetical protein
LFAAKVWSGSGLVLVEGPDMLDVRREISTSADMPLVSTLWNAHQRLEIPKGADPHRGFALITLPFARSMVASSWETDAGTSCD